MRRILYAFGVAASCALLPLTALAQTTGTGSPRITIEDARAIASANGIARIKEIELDDGRWEIEGTDSAGREYEMKIDARSGRIVKMEKD